MAADGIRGWPGAALAGLVLTALSVTACTESPPSESVGPPEYLGIETQRMDGELVNFRVRMSGADGNDDLIAYARCAAAQYSLIRGYGFARHLRTNVHREGGIWRADAVYTISPALPQGLQTIDAEVTVADCREQGIPTV